LVFTTGFGINTIFRRRHIVIGQYLGFTALVLVSLSGFFGGRLFPQTWIGMLGIVPIALGVSQWLNRKDESLQELSTLQPPQTDSSFTQFLSPQTYGVASVTIANGGDNLGIYVPMFASCTWSSLAIVLSVFFSLVGVWCYAAYRLANLPALAQTLTRYGGYLVPFVFIALGISILAENQTLKEPSLMVITLTMGALAIIWTRMSEQSLLN
jgi:cadmium resistance transport/sequestration family protein